MKWLLPALVALLAVVHSASAQVAPNLHWQSIKTTHTRVSFSPGLEEIARRAAGSAERAWAALSAELHPPRGPIDIVVADNYDISNGYATNFPTNRIVIYARPTIDANSLKFVDDWIDLVVVHELTHLFHLDRTRGLWRAGQWIFGRNPFLFPNAYAPNWLAEGIAVHYESKLTGAGREIGTDFSAIARAHELGGSPPTLNRLSAASPNYPLGNTVYTYGTQIVEDVARAGGEHGMRDFIDLSAGRTIPFLLNTNSKRAFGVSFDSAFRAWTDSTRRDALRLGGLVKAPAPIVKGGWFSVRPRWVDDSTLIFGSVDPKSVVSLKEVRANGGAVRAVGARNTSDVTTPLPGGWRVFAQQEYTGPYTQRTDLWVERGGDQRRLTYSARLTHPDARLCSDAPATTPRVGQRDRASSATGLGGMPDLCIVAVQLTPGAARLVHVRATNNTVEITPLTAASSASLLSEPRWSHDGTRIAATHWIRGGISEIDILDRDGKVIRSVGYSRAVSGAPAWGPGDSTIYFTSDRSGRSAVYRASVRNGALVRVADSPTALYESEPSPDGTRIASFLLWGDGYDLTVLDAKATPVPADSISVLPPSRATPLATSDAPVGRYSAFSTLIPRYWTPTLEMGYDDATRFGLITGARDVVDRHAWQLTASYDAKHNEPGVDFNYSFSGFGTPAIGVGAAEVWDHPGIADSAREFRYPVGRRKRLADLSASFLRRGFRTFASLSVGGSYEWRDFRALDGVPFSLFAPAERASLASQFTYPSVFASASFSNARQPALALGPENGFIVGATVRQRWRSDAASATRATSVVGTLTGYRGFDLGGRIHHLIAARLAAGNQDATSASDFAAGGGSGGTVRLVPGVTIGEGRRTFFVRGFEPGSQMGSRALGANFEYRAPVALPARGLGALPVYFQRVSAVLFADGASAWCPAGTSTSPICPRATPQEWMGSIGAELHLDAAAQYDAPNRLRFGIAVPVTGARYRANTNPSVYFTIGLPF